MERQSGPKKNVIESSRRLDAFKANSERSITARKKAQECVMFLVENEQITPEQLIEMCNYIIPGQYEDVCLERCLAGFCGYPLCPNPYTDSYGSKTHKFHHNRVYDICRRRNFCSHVCFEASDLVLGQLSFTPHYLRETDDDNDDDQEKLNIIIPNLDMLKGKYGDLVHFGASEEEEDKDLLELKKSRPGSKSLSATRSDGTTDIARTVGDFAVAGLISATEQETTDDKPEDYHKTDFQNSNISTTDHMSSANKATTSNRFNLVDNVNESRKDESHEIIKNGIDDSKTKQKNTDMVSNKKKAKKKVHSKKNEQNQPNEEFIVVRNVEMRLQQWITWDTLLIFLGDKYLNGLLQYRGLPRLPQELGQNTLHSDKNKAKYKDLCDKLDRQELNEANNSEDVMSTQQPKKPLPDMETLRADVKNMTIKTRSFFEGKLEVEVGDRDKAEDDKDGPTNDPTLPLIDAYDKIKWRRTIVLQKLHLTERDLLPSLNIHSDAVRPIFTQLVHTFNLKQNNLYLKPLQWTLVLISLLKLLSIRYSAIQHALSMASEENIIPLLSIFGLDPQYLDRLLMFYTEERFLLMKYNEKLGDGEAKDSSQTQPEDLNTSCSHPKSNDELLVSHQQPATDAVVCSSLGCDMETLD